MKGTKGIIALLFLAALLVGGFEFMSPRMAATHLHTSAIDVAYAGAHSIFTERSSQKPFEKLTADARAASIAQAKKDNVTLTTFTLDNQEHVHVTVSSSAPSLVRWIGAWRNWHQVSRSATVAPE